MPSDGFDVAARVKMHGLRRNFAQNARQTCWRDLVNVALSC